MRMGAGLRDRVLPGLFLIGFNAAMAALFAVILVREGALSANIISVMGGSTLFGVAFALGWYVRTERGRIRGEIGRARESRPLDMLVVAVWLLCFAGIRLVLAWVPSITAWMFLAVFSAFVGACLAGTILRPGIGGGSRDQGSQDRFDVGASTIVPDEERE